MSAKLATDANGFHTIHWTLVRNAVALSSARQARGELFAITSLYLDDSDDWR